MSGQWSTREREHATTLLNTEEPARGVEQLRQSTSASTYANDVTVNRVDKGSYIEIETVKDTPEARKAAWDLSVQQEAKKNAAIDDFWVKKRKADKEKADRVAAERAIVEARHRAENARVAESIVSHDEKAQIRAIMCPNNLDILDAVTALVREWRMERLPEAWASAVKVVRGRQ